MVFLEEILCNLRRANRRIPGITQEVESPPILLPLRQLPVSPPERGLLSSVVSLSVPEFIPGGCVGKAGEIPILFPSPLL